MYSGFASKNEAEAAWHDSFRTSLPPMPPPSQMMDGDQQQFPPGDTDINSGHVARNIPQPQHHFQQAENSLVQNSAAIDAAGGDGLYASSPLPASDTAMAPSHPHLPGGEGYYSNYPPRGSQEHQISLPQGQRSELLERTAGVRGLDEGDGSPRFGRHQQRPATEQDLQDAMESLQHARLRHKRFAKDRGGGGNDRPSDTKAESDHDQMKLQSSSKSKQPAAVGIARSGTGNTSQRKVLSGNVATGAKLRSEVSHLESQVQDTKTAAKQNDHLMKNQMDHIITEISAVDTEVKRLEHVVGVMRETVAIGRDKVVELQCHLRNINADKEVLTVKLQHFMTNTKGGVAQASREMATLDSEIERLSRENEFLRVQAPPRAR